MGEKGKRKKAAVTKLPHVIDFIYLKFKILCVEIKISYRKW